MEIRLPKVKFAQVTVPVYQALGILSSLEVKYPSGQQSAQQAQNLVDRLESCVKKVVDQLTKVPVGVGTTWWFKEH